MFLEEPTTPEAAEYIERNRADNGYVMNLSRVWAWRPDVADAFGALRLQLVKGSALTERERAILVCASARAAGDSYCSLAWGTRLAEAAGAAVASAVLQGRDAEGMTPREAALRAWAERVVRDPGGTDTVQIDALRAAGLSDREIFEATVFVAFRLAFALVNDALGARPDAELAKAAPPEVRTVVTYGRKPLG